MCVSSEAVLRKIREACDRTNTVSSAIATYVALTEIASDETKERFTTTHAWIARMSGLGIRTVQTRLKELVEIGALAIEPPDLRAPSTYYLLAFGNGCASSGNGCAAFGNGQKHTSLPTSEEQQKNHSEEQEKNVGNLALEPDNGKPPMKKRSAGASLTSDEAFLDSLSKDPAYQGIDVMREHSKMSRWCEVNRKQPTRRRFINWLNRADRLMAEKPSARTPLTREEIIRRSLQ